MKQLNKLFKGVLFYLFLTSSFIASAQQSISNKDASNMQEHYGKTKSTGINVKLSPSLFWKTLNIETEYALTNKLSASLNGFYKIGRTDGKNVNYIIKDENYLNNGYRIETALRYFPGDMAPSGLYYQGYVGFGNILNYDGTTKPFSINNKWKKVSSTKEPIELDIPKPYSVGAAVGYQFVIPSRRMIANINGGIQTNFTSKGTPYLSAFLSPSVGIFF